MFPREFQARARLRHAMDAAERLQRGIVERLHAERQAIDAGGAIAAKTLRLDASRIGFERDLRVGRNRPQPRDRLEHRGDGRWLHQRRRAAAEEDRGDGAPRGQLREVFKLARERGRKARLVRRLMADVAVEIAIRALRRAERPMHIDAESGCALGNVDRRALSARPDGARARSLNARARCDKRLRLSGTPAVLLLGAHLAERPRMSVGQEDRIVAETLIAARRPDERSVDAAGEGLDLVAAGVASASAATKCARRFSGVVAPFSCSASSTFRIATEKSFVGPAQRAE